METWFTTEKSCPCKRTKCERHGDCEACRAHHNAQKRKLLTACERLEKKASGAGRRSRDKG